jgi:hypothetical protein
MNDLTIALSLLAAVVLGGVVAHGAWQARRAGPRRPAAAVREEPREPVLGHAPPPAERREPTIDLPPPAFELRPLRRTAPRLDALVDAIVPLTIEHPVAGETVLAHLPPTRRAGSKPFLVEGLSADDGGWEAIAAGRSYSEFQAGVQLANRTGAINEIEYSEFVQKVQAFAEAIGAMPDFPDMLDVVGRARELDAFAGDHDAQLALRLAARAAAWSAGYIHQHAQRHGFVAGAVPGRLVMPAAEEGAPPVLTLGFDSQAALADDPNQAVVRALTLSFDVPQTDRRAEPFAAWQKSAEALAAEMDAVVVDDAGRPLAAEGFAAIGAELDQLYEKLEQRDLAAGSPAARRLFS